MCGCRPSLFFFSYILAGATKTETPLGTLQPTAIYLMVLRQLVLTSPAAEDKGYSLFPLSVRNP